MNMLGGDASMTELEAKQSKESLLAHIEGKKRKATDQEVGCDSLSLYTYKFKRQKLHKKSDHISEGNDVESTTVRRGRVGYQEFGILRTKPGRVDSEPTLSMSCRHVSL
jgi:tRNA-specific adenosine deaminase 1